MEISIYANFGLVYGKNCSRYPNIVSHFLKWNIKGMFSVKIIALKIFILKLVKIWCLTTLFKNNRERFIFDKSANIFLEVPTFVSSVNGKF